MLSFNKLGSHGRLGNQMFQYAALKGIARNRNFNFSIPYSLNLNEWYDHQLLDFFNLDKDLTILYEPINQNNVFYEKRYEFDNELFETVSDDTDLFGYFQSYKYFNHIKDEIYEDFKIKKEVFDIKIKNYTCLHIRRGDYVHQPESHPLCSLEYYKNAMEVTGGPFVIVSDDIEWCKQNIVAEEYFSFSNIQDLNIMINAKNNVIANSSFSWWGAWLNQNTEKVVVAPRQWFGSSLSHQSIEDLIPDEWILM